MGHRSYDDQFVRRVLEATSELGVERAAKQHEVSPTTVRRWRRAQRASAPACMRCGRLIRHARNLEGRVADYCRSCATIVAADKKRGIPAAELARLYVDEYQSTTQLASLTGRSQGGIVSLLKRHGVTLRSRGSGARIRKGGAPTHGRVSRQAILVLHHEGVSVTKIAATLGVSTSTVAYHVARDPRCTTGDDVRAVHGATIEDGDAHEHVAVKASNTSEPRFSRNLRLLIGIYGLTGTQTAKLVGVSDQSLSEWLNAKQSPGWRSIKMISKIFDLPVDLLMEGTQEEVGAHQFTGGRYSRVHRRIPVELEKHAT